VGRLLRVSDAQYLEYLLRVKRGVSQVNSESILDSYCRLSSAPAIYLPLITNSVVLSTKGHGCPKMSIEPPSLTAPTTLDAVIKAVLARTDIGVRRRQEMASAVRVMSRLLGQPATDIPADPQLLRGRVAQITAAAAGLRAAR
jgi:hypothetical protein